jgi:hypothetical protein
MHAILPTHLITLDLNILIVLYCSILLHYPLIWDQFTILCANTCQFLIFTIQNLKFLKVLKITTIFYQYGPRQVLKSTRGNCCYSAVVAYVPLMRTCVCNVWRFLLEFLYAKFLYIVWLLVCVFTVLGVSCSLLFFFACFVLELLLGWTDSSFYSMIVSLSVVYWLYYLEYWVVDVNACVVHLQSVFSHVICVISL